MARDRGAGGLLEAVRGEVEPGGEVAELRLGPASQRRLGQGGGRLLGRRLLAEAGLGGERVVAGVLLGAREQGLPVVGEQPPEGVEVHPAILPVATGSGTH